MRQRGRDRRPPPADKHKINEKIEARQLRLIGVDGDQLGVVTRDAALQRAEDEGVDLVMVSENSDPPVCRLLDYGKLKYKESKKAAEARKHSASQTVKEIRVRYRIDSHDLDTKIRNAKKFLDGGDRVKFQMRFRGREMAYKQLGDELFDKIIELLDEEAEVEQRTPLVGNSMTMTFVPKQG